MSRQANDDLIRMVKDAGIVGEGGAGFPAHVKFDTQVDTVIAVFPLIFFWRKDIMWQECTTHPPG